MEWYDVDIKLPPASTTVLCMGKSYDSDYQDGKFLARLMNYEDRFIWVIGKQEEEPEEVTHWAFI